MEILITFEHSIERNVKLQGFHFLTSLSVCHSLTWKCSLHQTFTILFVTIFWYIHNDSFRGKNWRDSDSSHSRRLRVREENVYFPHQKNLFGLVTTLKIIYKVKLNICIRCPPKQLETFETVSYRSSFKMNH